MSAECSKCGRDIEYPAGTWPLGECPVCDRAGFADPSWFDPIPGETGVLGMTLEQLADAVLVPILDGQQKKAGLDALDEILRRISSATGDN